VAEAYSKNMTPLEKIIGLGKGFFMSLKREREIKSAIRKKGLDKFLQEYKSGQGQQATIKG